MFNLFSRGKDKIQNPAILIGTIGNAQVFPQDRAIYQHYSNIADFKGSTLSDLEAFLAGKTFDIVHLFINFSEDGTVEAEAGIKLLQLLTKADVKLAVFASGNAVDSYMAAFPVQQRKGVDKMTLVLTLDRKGDNFFNFFKGIFEHVAKGKSFPMAWVTLAPQHNGPWMEKMPDALVEVKRGNLKFVP